MRSLLFLLAVAVLTPAYALEVRDLSPSLEVSTFGYGGSCAVSLARDLHIRIGYRERKQEKSYILEGKSGNPLDFSRGSENAEDFLFDVVNPEYALSPPTRLPTTEEDSDIEFRAKGKFGGPYLSLEARPFKRHTLFGGMLIVGGFGMNFADVRGALVRQEWYIIDHRRYESEEIGDIQLKAHYKRFAPFMGLGWGRDIQTPFGDLRLSTMATLTYPGRAHVEVSSTGTAAPVDPAALEAIRQEAEEALGELRTVPGATFVLAF